MLASRKSPNLPKAHPPAEKDYSSASTDSSISENSPTDKYPKLSAQSAPLKSTNWPTRSEWAANTGLAVSPRNSTLKQHHCGGEGRQQTREPQQQLSRSFRSWGRSQRHCQVLQRQDRRTCGIFWRTVDSISRQGNHTVHSFVWEWIPRSGSRATFPDCAPAQLRVRGPRSPQSHHP